MTSLDEAAQLEDLKRAMDHLAREMRKHAPLGALGPEARAGALASVLRAFDAIPSDEVRAWALGAIEDGVLRGRDETPAARTFREHFETAEERLVLERVTKQIREARSIRPDQKGPPDA